jgi:hypothetical protein
MAFLVSPSIRPSEFADGLFGSLTGPAMSALARSFADEPQPMIRLRPRRSRAAGGRLRTTAGGGGVRAAAGGGVRGAAGAGRIGTVRPAPQPARHPRPEPLGRELAELRRTLTRLAREIETRAH